MRFLALIAACLPGPALADPTAPGTLIAAISGDWNGDDALDAAILTRAEDGLADLTLYRGGGFHGLEPVLVLDGQIFAGPMAGQAPGFEPHGETAFILTTEQTGIGRNPWFQRLTIAYRDGDYLVAGFTHDFYDRLDPGHYGTCDVNLLTGAYEIVVSRGDAQPDGGIVEGSAVEERMQGRGEPGAFAVSAYRQDFWPEACNALY